MKLDRKIQEALMNSHTSRHDEEMNSLLDVPMIRESVSRHSSADMQQGFTQTTIKTKSEAA